MAVKQVGYKEPKSYFNEAMKKADRDYDKKLKQKEKESSKPTPKKKK